MSQDKALLAVGDTGIMQQVILLDDTVAAPGTTLDPYDPTTWAPLDLTEVDTVAMHVRSQVSAADLGDVTLNRQSPYESGRCLWIWPTGFFVEPGNYAGEIVITYLDSRIATVYAPLQITVRGRFA
jgi:hypothetical protein